MLKELAQSCESVGLLLSEDKTKIMTNSIRVPINLAGKTLEYVEDFMYLGLNISFKDREKKVIQTRINNAWKQFWDLKDILQGTISTDTVQTSVTPLQPSFMSVIDVFSWFIGVLFTTSTHSCTLSTYTEKGPRSSHSYRNGSPVV